jgi:hypothetical protein
LYFLPLSQGQGALRESFRIGDSLVVAQPYRLRYRFTEDFCAVLRRDIGVCKPAALALAATGQGVGPGSVRQTTRFPSWTSGVRIPLPALTYDEWKSRLHPRLHLIAGPDDMPTAR